MKKKIVLALVAMLFVQFGVAMAEWNNVSKDQWIATTDADWYAADCDEIVNNEVYDWEFWIYLDAFNNESRDTYYIFQAITIATWDYLLYNTSLRDWYTRLLVLNKSLLEQKKRAVGPKTSIRHMTTAEEVNDANFKYNDWRFSTPFVDDLDNKEFYIPNYMSDWRHPATPTQFPSWDAEFRTITLYDKDNDITTTKDNKAIIECQRNVIRWCGDGILDKTHEQCDPQDPSHTWWWDGWCDPSCKPNNWKLKVEKTLIWSKEIQNVGDIVEWKIKVTAEGSDMSNFDIVDDLTNAPVLAYSGYEIMHKGSVDSITFGWENKATHRVLWYVKWTLKQNDYIEIKVITYAKQMPDKEYKNVACVKINETQDCTGALVPSPKLRIKKSFTDWTKHKTVKIWDEIWYKITFGNSWTAAATITSIKDFLPKNVQYKSSKIYIVAGNNSNTIQDGVSIDIYGWITLKPHTEWYIILSGIVLWEYTGSTQNWACIYLNDTKIDCDDAIHDITWDVIWDLVCKNLRITNTSFGYQWGQTSVVCEASSANADSIEIDCGNGLSFKWLNVGSLTKECNYPANNSSSTKSYSVTCKVNGVSADNCKWIVTVGREPTPPTEHAICKKIDYDNGYPVCYSTNSKAHFKLACDGKTYYYEDSRERSHKFKECKNPEYAKCYVKADDDTMWKTNDDCTDGEPEPFDAVNEQCFNVNAWNFSIEEWEIFPFYWNMRNMRNESWVAEGNYTEIKGNYQNATSIYNEYAWKSCSQAWSVAKDSMICEFNIYDGDVYHKGMQDWEAKDKPLYTI